MRPIEHLPMPFPCDFDPGPEFFYENFVKAFIPDMIQMMSTGLTINDIAVEELRVTIDKVLESVHARLAVNQLIKNYQLMKLPAAQKAYAEKCTQAVRDSDHYLKKYNPADILHRTWVVNHYLTVAGKPNHIKDKWTIAAVKKLNILLKSPFLTSVINKRPMDGNTHVIAAMRELAEYKAELWNRPRQEKAKKPITLPAFNPGSSLQKKELFEMLKIAPKAYSKDTGEASWGRDQIVELKKETSDNPELVAMLDAFIDYSYSDIIKNNFLKAFDTFTIDDVLHGNIKLFGAKSFRNTSNSPNLLNAPSTGSIYAKPLKRCFVAPEGFIVYTADLSALEDRVIANLSGDKNKCNIFLEGLDGHSLNSCGYFKEEIEAIVGVHDDTVDFVKAFMAVVASGDKTADGIRFRSKAPTFKLAYGGYPDADKGGVITQEIFDNYHNVLYPGITKYREQYVLPTARRQGYLHLGLGCRIYSDDPDAHIRTLNNASVQFWSILTLIAVNEMNHRIREAGLVDDVKIHSTIYDSIYLYVREDAELIKWVNDNLIELMSVQYLEEETIHNTAEGEIGRNWADLVKLSNNASLEEISKAMSEI